MDIKPLMTSSTRLQFHIEERTFPFCLCEMELHLHVKFKVVDDKVLTSHSNTSKFIMGPINNFGYSCIHQVCCKLNNAKTELVSGVNLAYREYF